MDKSFISTKAFSATPKGVVSVSKMGRNFHWSMSVFKFVPFTAVD